MGKKIASLYAEIGADTTKLKNGLDETKTQLSKTKEGISNFASGLTKAFGFAVAELAILKKAFDFGKEQAMIEFTQKKFDNLARSIGTTSDALLGDLKRATGGLVSDLELVTSATDFMALGLVKTHDEAVRLTSVAGQLGMNMNQLVLTLTNQTTMRFDALGVSVAGFDEKVAALKATGMSANDAFNEAFLQQAEEQIKTVGSITDSSAASFLRMETAIKNLADKIKSWFVPALENAADAIYYLLNFPTDVRGVFDNHRQQVERTSKSYDAYATEVLRAAKVAKILSENQADAVQTFIDTGVVLPKNIDHVHNWMIETGLLTEEQWNAKYSTEAWGASTHNAILELLNAETATVQLTTAIEASKESMEKYKTVIGGALGKELKSFEEKHKSLADEAEKINDEIGKLESKKYLTTAQKEELEELKKKQEEIQGAIKATADEHELATKRILLDMMEQQMGMDGLSQKEQDVLMKVAADWDLIDDATLKAWEGMKTYTDSIDKSAESVDKLAEKLANIERNIDIDIWLKIHGLEGIQAIATMGGGGGSNEGFEQQAGGGPNMAGEAIQWGEYGRPEMYITPSSGQVVNAQQIVEAMRSSGVNTAGGGVTIEKLNVYTNSGVDAIQYSIERAKGYAL